MIRMYLTVLVFFFESFGAFEKDVSTIDSQGCAADRVFCLQKMHQDSDAKEASLHETMYTGFIWQIVLFKKVIENHPSGKVSTVARVGHEILVQCSSFGLDRNTRLNCLCVWTSKMSHYGM